MSTRSTLVISSIKHYTQHHITSHNRVAVAAAAHCLHIKDSTTRTTTGVFPFHLRMDVAWKVGGATSRNSYSNRVRWRMVAAGAPNQIADMAVVVVVVSLSTVFEAEAMLLRLSYYTGVAGSRGNSPILSI